MDRDRAEPGGGQGGDQDRLRFAPDVIVQMIGGEALILNLRDEEVFSLNATGARVAQAIIDGQLLDAVVDALSREYAMDRDSIRQQVDDLVETLLAKRLLVGETGSA
jgi:Coenzyme PQQ synthesis protein D (PqqD)